jgi:hypothetical protein
MGKPQKNSVNYNTTPFQKVRQNLITVRKYRTPVRRNLLYLILLAIPPLNITLFENPAQGNFNYSCSTDKYHVVVNTDDRGNLVYKAFSPKYNPDIPPDATPVLVLSNGEIISSGKEGNGSYRRTVIHWKGDEGLVYEINQSEQLTGDVGATAGVLRIIQEDKEIYKGSCQIDD